MSQEILYIFIKRKSPQLPNTYKGVTLLKAIFSYMIVNCFSGFTSPELLAYQEHGTLGC
jgi:hypothetical protein